MGGGLVVHTGVFFGRFPLQLDLPETGRNRDTGAGVMVPGSWMASARTALLSGTNTCSGSLVALATGIGYGVLRTIGTCEAFQAIHLKPRQHD